tara:strand:+ start:592 stop:726 length:135 start_codon:yes stop_codon:yes gene_type:complete
MLSTSSKGVTEVEGGVLKRSCVNPRVNEEVRPVVIGILYRAFFS